MHKVSLLRSCLVLLEAFTGGIIDKETSSFVGCKSISTLVGTCTTTMSLSTSTRYAPRKTDIGGAATRYNISIDACLDLVSWKQQSSLCVQVLEFPDVNCRLNLQFQHGVLDLLFSKKRFHPVHVRNYCTSLFQTKHSLFKSRKILDLIPHPIFCIPKWSATRQSKPSYSDQDFQRKVIPMLRSR